MTAPHAETATELPKLLPRWHFREQHERTVAGSPAAAYDAFRSLSLRELPVSRALFAIRSLPSRFTGGIGLPTGSQSPMLDLMMDAGFLLLADVPGTEIVVGLVEPVTRLRSAADAQPPDAVSAMAGRRLTSDPSARTDAAARADLDAAFVAYVQPGAVKIAMTFLFTPLEGGRTGVFTETRVLATDAAARRHFTVYWSGIRAFSGLIRLEWLRAIDRRTAAASGA